MRPSRLLMLFSRSGWAQMEAGERFGPGGGNSGEGVEECEHSKKPNSGSSWAVCSHNTINSSPMNALKPNLLRGEAIICLL